MTGFDPQQYWRIDDVVANEILGSMPSYTIGDKERLSFGFSPLANESEQEYANRVKQLTDRARHAGAYNINITMGNTPIYTESHNGDTLLTAIRSPSTSRADYSAWGLINSIDTARPDGSIRDAYTVTIEFLADYDEYENKTAVEAELMNEGI